MNITFFRFNIEEDYWREVEAFLKNCEATEYDLRNCLKHTSTNAIAEKCSRYYADEIIDCRDSYSIQSQRYVNFKDKHDFFYVPPEIIEKGQEKLFREHVNDMIEIYTMMVNSGINPEDSRFILPVTFYSNVKYTLQGDKLLDFIIFHYYYSKFDEFEEALNKFLEQFDSKYKILIDNIMRIVKSKEDEYRNFSRSSRIWQKSIEPGEFKFAFHNNLLLESTLGASICYRMGSPSEYIEKFGEEKQEELLKKIMASKHESVTEHGYMTIQFPISRIIHTHIHRHRLSKMTYTPIVDAAKNFSFVTPPDIKNNSECLKAFEQGMKRCKEVYDILIESGVSPENSSYVLPNATRIDVMITTNIRDIKHILRTRLCERAHWEIRGLAYRIFEELYKIYPLIFSDLGPSCYLGKCKEADMSCGKPKIFREFINNIKK